MKRENLNSKRSKKDPIKLRSFDAYLKEQLKDPKFKKGYEEEGKKIELGYQIFLARTKAGLTQGDLADRIGTRQSNISRMEFGNYNFTIGMLKKIAGALNLEIKIDLVSKRLDKAA